MKLFGEMFEKVMDMTWIHYADKVWDLIGRDAIYSWD